jgi:hypothetical protein
MLATLSWMRASRAADLRRLALPGALRACTRLARRSLRSDPRSGFVPLIVITLPALSTAVISVVTPRSTPTADRHQFRYETAIR